MYCSTYCKGKEVDAACDLISNPVKRTECIKSCLDCRTSNKDYCYCPGIFPPHQTMQTVNSDDEEGSIKARNLDAVIVPKNAPDPEEKSDDVLVFSILGAIIGLVIIGLVIFCVLRYLQFRRRYHIGATQAQTQQKRKSFVQSSTEQDATATAAEPP